MVARPCGDEEVVGMTLMAVNAAEDVPTGRHEFHWAGLTSRSHAPAKHLGEDTTIVTMRLELVQEDAFREHEADFDRAAPRPEVHATATHSSSTSVVTSARASLPGVSRRPAISPRG